LPGEAVRVIGVDLQNGGGAADRERRDDAKVGKLASDMDDRVSERELDGHHLVARQRKVRNRGPSGVGFSTRFSRPTTFV
jgi:hypothetical protein